MAGGFIFSEITMQGSISSKNLTVIYSNKGKEPVVAIKALSFEVEAGEFVSIIGPSGCGKSTTLNAIAGFIEPAEGKILLDDKEITSPGPDRGIVFQNYELFPWKTVFQNIEFGLKMSGMKKGYRKKLVEEYIQEIGLKGFEGSFPFELSGGMAQRVALARALINNPAVILLDEPFGALDAQTRITIQTLLLKVWESDHKTIIFVTHDIEEAIFLSDRIIVMSVLPGRVEKEFEVPLNRPRTYEMTASPEFSNLKLELYSAIREAVSKISTSRCVAAVK